MNSLYAKHQMNIRSNVSLLRVLLTDRQTDRQTLTQSKLILNGVVYCLTLSLAGTPTEIMLMHRYRYQPSYVHSTFFSTGQTKTHHCRFNLFDFYFFQTKTKM